MTATPFCILPTVSLNGNKIGNGKMGNVTNTLLEKWSKNVGLDIKTQIQEYGKEVSHLKASDASTPYQFKR